MSENQPFFQKKLPETEYFSQELYTYYKVLKQSCIKTGKK